MSKTNLDSQVHLSASSPPAPSTNLASIAIECSLRVQTHFSNSLCKKKKKKNRKVILLGGKSYIASQGQTHIIFRLCIVGSYLILHPCPAPRLPSPGVGSSGHPGNPRQRCLAHCLCHPPNVYPRNGYVFAVFL